MQADPPRGTVDVEHLAEWTRVERHRHERIERRRRRERPAKRIASTARDQPQPGRRAENGGHRIDVGERGARRAGNAFPAHGTAVQLMGATAAFDTEERRRVRPRAALEGRQRAVCERNERAVAHAGHALALRRAIRDEPRPGGNARVALVRVRRRRQVRQDTAPAVVEPEIPGRPARRRAGQQHLVAPTVAGS
jgi:hypothetical protein